MAKATNQSILRGIEGKVGDLVMRTINNRTVVAKAPKRRTKKSLREVENHTVFQSAAAFAVEAMRNPKLKIHFKNVAKKRRLPNAYTAALSVKLKELNAAKEDRPKAPQFSIDEQVDTAPAWLDLTKRASQYTLLPPLVKENHMPGSLECLRLQKLEHNVFGAFKQSHSLTYNHRMNAQLPFINEL